MSNRYHSDHGDPAPLGKPLHFEFANKTAPNRFLKASMSEQLASWDPKDLFKRGIPSDKLINLYKRWGEGGFGVILTGNLMVVPDHIEAAGNIIIPPEAHPEPGDARFEAFKQLANGSKAQGALIIAQVSHPGRQTNERLQPNPISASDIQIEGEVIGMRYGKPRAATENDITTIKNHFVHVAKYLYKAGYDGIQLHGAHGYLLAQFLSQSTNKRTDDYGGSLPNRARLITEVATQIRQAIPASTGFILGIKINSVEFQDSGFSPIEAAELVTLLELHGFDFIELSGGTYESLAFVHKRESTKQREAFFIEFAEQIVKNLKHTRSYVTGGFKTVGAMVRALDVVDGVGLARAAAQEPRLPRDILEGMVTGAIEQKLDPNNFGLGVGVAGTLLRMVGTDLEPVDMSQGENVGAVLGDLGAWMARMGEDWGQGRMELFGFPDVKSVEVKPYGNMA